MKKQVFALTSSTLHILGMIFMLCDHLWATVIPGNQWMNTVGRIALPIFAFLIVEGYFHTRDLRKYILRLLIAAAISEIPFNLMNCGSLFYPIHQNVLWTFLLGLLFLHLNEMARAKNKLWLSILTAALTTLFGYAVGYAFFVDFYGAGVITVLIFYFFRKRKWWNLLLQIAALYYVNVELLSGLYFEVSLFGQTFPVIQQGFALLALIPIWLYRGQKGGSKKWFQWLCYAFYPLHMLILYILSLCT